MTDDQLLSQLKILNDQGLYRSVEILGSFLMTSNENPTSECLLQFANALFSREEYRRALSYYKQALQNQKTSSQVGSTNSKGKNHVVELRYKIAQCHLKLKEHELALQELKNIPAASRTLAINMCLARIYHQVDGKRLAVSCYKEALKQNPYAVEAVLALIELGVNVTEILAAYYNNIPAGIKWLQNVIKAFALEHTYEYKKALSLLSTLDKQFNSNLYILQNVARCYVRLGDAEKAQHIFQKIRVLDSNAIDYMDAYASILKAQGNVMELNRLCFDLMNVNSQTRPEPWTCVSLYSELRGQKEKALGLVERALAIDSTHAAAHITKGGLLLGMGLAEEAASAYRKASAYHNELAAFQGLVKSYLALSRYPDAFVAAKEVYTLMPQSPRAITLYASVLSHYPDTRKKALALFQEVFGIEPHCIDAVLALSQLYVWEHQNQKAIELLKKQLQHNNKDVLHIRMAEVLALTNELSEAMLHFHTALRLNPSSELARQGLERIEKIANECSANVTGSGAGGASTSSAGAELQQGDAEFEDAEGEEGDGFEDEA